MQGTLPSQEIGKLIADGRIVSTAKINPAQVQPSSLDLTLSRRAFSMPGSLMPLPGERVTDLIERYSRYPVDLKEPGVLVRDNVYLILLAERFELPADIGAYANNKSSTGRIDLQTRVLCDGTPRYDKIPEGYKGELWLEVIPKSFDVKVRAGDSLNQTIFYAGRTMLAHGELASLMLRKKPLLYQPDGKAADGAHLIGDGLLMTLDLEQPVAGFKARKSIRPIDFAAIGQHEPKEFFEAIERPPNGTLFLSQGDFYIFSTYEYVSVPPEYAVEMLPYDTSAGEFRAHYAGFFDPGFGYGEKGEVKGTPAVLEVRPYEDDLIVRHRQPVCKMAYEKLSARPDKLYGVGMTSNYAAQRGPRLSKFFRQ
jgi:dCTP deaminase